MCCLYCASTGLDYKLRDLRNYRPANKSSVRNVWVMSNKMRARVHLPWSVIYGPATIVKLCAGVCLFVYVQRGYAWVSVGRDSSKVVNDRWHFRPLTRAKMARLPRDVYVIRRSLSSNLDDARKLCHLKPLS